MLDLYYYMFYEDEAEDEEYAASLFICLRIFIDFLALSTTLFIL